MVWVEVRPCRRVRIRRRIGFAGRIGGLCGLWSAWWPPPASASASTERSSRARRNVVAAGAVRGAGDRRPLRHLRRPGEPGEAERAHDRAHVVVLPAFSKPARKDAVTYLAGGPGDAATEQAADLSQQLSALNMYRDILLVDQRGTGRSNPHGGDVTQYGTRMAMDDLDAVRAALGYRQLDVIGSSYGATAAQVYLKLHPSSVRTLMLSGATAIDVPFFGRYAVNAQRALDQLARLCASDPACRKAFPGWERQFGELVKAWNAHPEHGMTGDELASVVHVHAARRTKAVSIPLVVSSAAKGDYGPLEQAGSGDLDADLNLMSKSIWCNEPWAGLDATGPWGTDFDSYTTARIAAFRQECSSVPKRAEPRSLWTLPTSSPVPVLALVGGADPQDPSRTSPT